LIEVEACDEEDSTASCKIQVSQDFEELIDGDRVYGAIKGKTIDEEDLSHYKFYKFYKACEEEDVLAPILIRYLLLSWYQGS
jgi:hypothetical protein